MILPLEKQVSSLEPSKRLKELNVRQESLFYWQGTTTLKYIVRASWELLTWEGCENYSAFTVAELGELLPKEVIGNECRTVGGGWRYDFGDEQAVYADTEADARAKMLIYLLENNLLKL